MKAKVHVFLKPGVLDVQGKAIEGALHTIGFPGASNVRVGKTIELDIDGDAATAEQQAKGAPVAIKYLDVVPTTDYYAAIMKNAPHPNAAACFLAWWGSPDGQATMFKNEFKRNLTDPPGLPAGAKLVPINTPDQAKVANSTADALAKLMQ